MRIYPYIPTNNNNKKGAIMKIQTFRDLAWWIKNNADLDAEIEIEITSFENLGEEMTTVIRTTNKDGELIECELQNTTNKV